MNNLLFFTNNSFFPNLFSSPYFLQVYVKSHFLSLSARLISSELYSEYMVETFSLYIYTIVDFCQNIASWSQISSRKSYRRSFCLFKIVPLSSYRANISLDFGTVMFVVAEMDRARHIGWSILLNITLSRVTSLCWT